MNSPEAPSATSVDLGITISYVYMPIYCSLVVSVHRVGISDCFTNRYHIYTFSQILHDPLHPSLEECPSA